MKAKEAIECFREDLLQRGRSETTWQGDYWKILKRLDPGSVVTADTLHKLVLSTSPNTKTRKRACMVTHAFARFHGIDYNPKPYEGKYSPKRPKPRDIPDDQAIFNY